MVNNKYLYVPILISIIYIASSINPSYAFEYGGVKWPDSGMPVSYYINENTSDTAGEGAACQAAAQTWTDVSTSFFSFQYAGSTTKTAPKYDGSNVLAWGSTNGSIATTYIWYVGDRIVECDMEFEDGYDWGTTGGSGMMDVQNIATHEFGHFLLLLDLYGSGDSAKTMYGYGSYGETKKRSLEADDIAGISFIYPSAGGSSINADFSASPQNGYAPLIVNFTDASSSTGDITSWSWDFGDGDTSTEQNPSHTYTNTGTYTVSLEITGTEGTDTETKTNYINVNGVNAAFSASPKSGYAPLTVNFNDSSGGDITDWLWDFGDGTTSSDPEPSHTYGSGVYTVSLQVSGPYGSDTETKTNYITVESDAINAVFTASPITGFAPLTVQFTDLTTSTKEITDWLWRFGDGTTSTEQNPSHTYTSRGRYSVSLQVTNADGTDITMKLNYIRVRRTKVTPSVTMISPNNETPGSQVTIYGSGFGDEQGDKGCVLFKKKKKASIVSWSDDEIVCTVPDGARSGNVKVRNDSKRRSNRVYFEVTP